MTNIEKREEIQQIGFNMKSSAMRLLELSLKGLSLLSKEDINKYKGENEEFEVYMTQGLDNGELEYNVHFDVVQKYSSDTLDSISKNR